MFKCTLTLIAAFLLLPVTTQAQLDSVSLDGLRYRNIGPFRGGRVTAVAGVRQQLCTFYMGATGGGVWKTVDCGNSWHNVSDGFFASGSIGAIAVADSNPDIVYVATGSAAIRSNVIQGRGLYKSVDAGKSWTFVGLRTAGQIGSIRVHPRNPDIAYVAALGQPFGPGQDRGVFRTRDGGKTWQKVLFVNERTGVVSLAMDPADPDVVYAGAWRGERKPWTIISGGPASETGLYKTTDGGNTWKHVSNGLPGGLIGKIDVDVSRASPRRVYVILEASEGQGGVYRSEDGGGSFTRINADPQLIARPFYYTYIDADPKNPDIVWVNNLALWRSQDGGRTFERVPAPHGDMHGMWINPDNPSFLIQSNDGGANVSVDGGRSWSTQFNQSTAEIYGVEVDNQFPYRVYGAQQDTGRPLILPSRPPWGDRLEDPIQLWMDGPGCETGPVKPNIANAQVVYGVCKGEFSRLSLVTGQESHYWIYPQNRYGHNPKDMKYRMQRVTPFELSPHDPGVIYFGSQFLHRTTDEGHTWEVISPDLTANDPDKQVVSGEPITRDITGEEVYSTIYAIEESPLERGVIWVGANDGPIHVTRDGKTWRKVTPADLPPGGRVQNIEASPHRRGSAYLAVNRSQLDDWQPYIYRTDDYGVTWTRLSGEHSGIPRDFPARVVREDPDREGLLYAGTEFGIFVSGDNGAKWRSLQLNLPVTPVTDIKIYRKDLILSTMGRGFWILDDIAPLHQLAQGPPPSSAVRLLPPREAVRARWAPMGSQSDEPDYPQPSAFIDYIVADVTARPTIEIADATGAIVRAFPDVPVKPGLNRLAWDMRAAAASAAGPAAEPRGARLATLVPPGRYEVRLTTGAGTQTQALELRSDPRLALDGITAADLREQYSLNLRLIEAIGRARQLVTRIDASIKTASDVSRQEAMQALRARLVTADGPYPQPMLIDQLQNVLRMTSQADQRIGRDAFTRLDDLEKELEDIGQQSALDARVQRFLETHRGRWHDMNVPAVDGQTLHDIIVQNKYTRALEIGTSTGHSGIWIAWALSKTGGELITIDIDEERHREARRNFEEAGLSKVIDSRLGDAHEIVPALKGPFDFVFSDADKNWYKNYLVALLPKLEVGGCYVTHNVSRGRRGWGSGDYADYLIGLAGLETTFDDRGAGMSISYKRTR
jgi:predicted O-methyltransferase YrrM/photosystem II stability/assembly factor-like uncharacterized protein